MRRVRRTLRKHANKLRLATLPLAAILLLIGTFVPSSGVLGYGVVVALVAVRSGLRVVRGSVQSSETGYANKLLRLASEAQLPATDPVLREPRARVDIPKGYPDKRSRHLRRYVRKHRLQFDADEVFVVELRRHPLSMLSPTIFAALLASAWKVIVAVAKIVFSDWRVTILSAFVFAGIGYVLYTYRYVLLGIFLVLFAAILFVWIRYWLVQSIVFTNKRLIVFKEWSTKRPWVQSLPRASEVDGTNTVPAATLAWLRFVGLPWGEIAYISRRADGVQIAHPVLLMKGIRAPKALPVSGLFRSQIRQLPPAP